jgi:hypothetical protein
MTARQFLTFRLDLEFRRRLRTRLAGEGRSLSEVVIRGLQLYLQQGGAPSDEPRPGASADPATPGAVLAPPGAATGPSPANEPGLGPGPGPAAGPGSGSGVGPGPEPGPGVGPAPEVERGAATDPGPPTTSAPATTAVASAADLTLPDEIEVQLRDLRRGGQSELLSATLAALHDAGWPLRPLATALGISRQAVLARIRQPVPAKVRSLVPSVTPPAPFPRRRSAQPGGRRPHITVKIDQALRAAAHRKAQREGSSLSQVIERILDHYLRHGLPHGEIQLGDTTPTRPAARRKRQSRAAPERRD